MPHVGTNIVCIEGHTLHEESFILQLIAYIGKQCSLAGSVRLVPCAGTDSIPRLDPVLALGLFGKLLGPPALAQTAGLVDGVGGFHLLDAVPGRDPVRRLTAA